MNVSKAKYGGKKHRENKETNEDHVLAQQITKNVSVVVVADGAGSKKHGGATADCITKYVVQYCTENANREDFLDCVMSGLFSYVNRNLLNMIQEADGQIDDYGATMLFAIVCGNRYFAGHIGDGVILLKNGIDFKVLSLPENGEYINQTYFLPIVAQTENFRMYQGVLEKEFCFILTSDGISGTLYNQIDNQVSCVCQQFYQLCKSYDSKECDEILKENLVKVFDKYSDDDKSIALLCDSSE